MREAEYHDRRYDRMQATLRAYRGGLLLCLIIIIILAAILLSGRGQFARAIKIDGKLVGLVRNKAAADEIRSRLLKEGKGGLPGVAVFEQQWEDITYKVEDVEDMSVKSVPEAIELLRPIVTVLVSAVAIEVDGQQAVVMATKDLADTVLAEVKRQYVSEGDKLLERQKFRQEVRFADTSSPAERISTDLGTAVERLTESYTTAKTYVVKAGDWPAKIAAAHGMSTTELFQLNPGLRGRTIYPGEKLKVSAAATPLTVVTVKEETEIKEVAPETQEIAHSSLPRGERQVMRAGKPGKKKYFFRVVYENSRRISKQALKGQWVEQPQARVVYVGTGEPAGGEIP